MSVDLQKLVDSVDGFERPVVSLLRATLEYEADTSLVAVKLADDIKFICRVEVFKIAGRSGDSNEGLEDSLFYVWMLVIDIARCIPQIIHGRIA